MVIYVIADRQTRGGLNALPYLPGHGDRILYFRNVGDLVRQHQAKFAQEQDFLVFANFVDRVRQ